MAKAKRKRDLEYMSKYICARYAVLKLRAIGHKGGKCQQCGYNKCLAALEFHHRDPTQKEVDWRRLRRRAWAFIVLELDKCDLLCANCHREEHYDPTTLEKAQEFLRTRKGAKQSVYT